MIVGTQLVIFGGLNTENFLPPELYALELDPYHSKRIRADEKMRKVQSSMMEEYRQSPKRGGKPDFYQEY